MYGNSLSVRRIGKVTLTILFQGSPPWHKIKMVWTRSRIGPRPCRCSPSLGNRQEGPGFSRAVPTEDPASRHRGLQAVSTAVQIITPNLPFGIALSWVYIFSVTQEVIHCSDTSWAQSTTLGFIIQVTPNIALQMSQPSRCQRLAIWCRGQLVGRVGGGGGIKALDSSVARLWFNLQSTSRQFLLELQSNIPQYLLV